MGPRDHPGDADPAAFPRREAPHVGSRIGLLQFRGRRSGRDDQLPVGMHCVDGRLHALTDAGWRANFRGGHPRRLRVGGSWREGTGIVVEDPDEVAAFYADRIDEVGGKKAGRQLGIRVNVDRTPTRDELREAVERSGLSLLHLQLDGVRRAVSWHVDAVMMRGAFRSCELQVTSR